MIISRITDGFGNQLFMYACGYAVAQRLNRRISLDITILDTNPTREFELNKLNIEYEKIFTVKNHKYKWSKILHRELIKRFCLKNYKRYQEVTPYKFDEQIEDIDDNTYISGYWQSEKYFKEFREDLVKLYTPKYKLSEGAVRYIELVKKSESVAVHVRLGDYKALGNCLDIGYYIEAINDMCLARPHAVFYVFSDEIDCAKQLFDGLSARLEYVQYKSDNLTLDDFFIMKNCSNQIIANSSFSWWAAWLNENINKIVICPEKGEWTGDFYPEEWKKIKCI